MINKRQLKVCPICEGLNKQMTRHIKVIFWDNHIVFFFLASMKEFQLDVFRQFTRMFPKQKPTKLLKHVGFYKKQSGPSKVRCSICNEYRSDLHITWKKKYVSFLWPKQAQVSLMESVLGRKLPYILLWLFILM